MSIYLLVDEDGEAMRIQASSDHALIGEKGVELQEIEDGSPQLLLKFDGKSVYKANPVSDNEAAEDDPEEGEISWELNWEEIL